MSFVRRNERKGFQWGLTPITAIGEQTDDTGIGFSILKLRASESADLCSSYEQALLLMHGEARFSLEGNVVTHTRHSLFDEAPFAVHTCCNTPITVHAVSDVEIAVMVTTNEKEFPAKIYGDTVNEHRGAGQVGECSLRYVRTVFDGSTSHPNTELVLGEVVNFPGRWSSYPPHHHPQPEIYHYRFDKPQGYGHAELGEEVMKVYHGDTVKILDSVDHAQVSAPGYAMYYIWVIRHLAGNRYTVPEFTREHVWTQDVSAPIWEPQEQEVLV